MIDQNELNSEAGRRICSRSTNDVARIMFQVLSVGLLIGAVLLTLRPFLISIVWAGMIVITTWPLLCTLQARLKNKRGLAVAIMTLGLMLVFVLPLLYAIAAVIQKAPVMDVWLKSLTTLTIPPPPKWLTTIPLAGPRITGFWQEAIAMGTKGVVDAYLAPYTLKAVGWLASQAGTIGLLAIQFLITVAVSAILYARGEAVSERVLAFARRLAGEQGEAVAILAVKAVRGVALGIVVTAILQAFVAGAGLFITGVPGAILLTGVIVVLCLAQIGPLLVLVPSIIWAYSQLGVLWGSILVVFSVLAITLDNFLRPMLIKKGADLPLILVLAGVIGGLIAFGIIGLFIGPVVLAAARTLLDAWIDGGAVAKVDEESKCEMGSCHDN